MCIENNAKALGKITSELFGPSNTQYIACLEFYCQAGPGHGHFCEGNQYFFNKYFMEDKEANQN